MPDPRIPTLPTHRSGAAARRARDLRRAGLSAIALLLIAGLLSLLGVRSGTVTARADGYVLTVTYPQVTRPGVATPFKVRVEHAGGFGGPITLALPRQMFERLDFQNHYPNASTETGAPRFVYSTFDPPPGDVFALSADARTSADQNGAVGRYRVVFILGDRPVTEVSFRMVVVP